MTYPILAAINSKYIDKHFVSSDTESIISTASTYGFQAIERPPELCGEEVGLDKVIQHAAKEIEEKTDAEILVVLICNAPTVNSELIDQGIKKLLADKSMDSAMTVTKNREHHPSRSLIINTTGSLDLMLPEMSTPTSNDSLTAFFPDSLMYVLRIKNLKQKSTLAFPFNLMGKNIAPVVHEGYGDIDYPWQLPAIKQWLIKEGYTENKTPYDQNTSSNIEIKSLSYPASKKVFISTVPFGSISPKPIKLLKKEKIDFTINPIGRKLKEEELAKLLQGYDALIAGTERISQKVMKSCPSLKLISRVGIGLDNIDMPYAKKQNILLSYTPEPPAPAVAELTVGLIMSSLRGIHKADQIMRSGHWSRLIGSRLEQKCLGIIGLGRIGKKLVQLLSGFNIRILANDLIVDDNFAYLHNISMVSKEKIYEEADIISLHLPLTEETHHLIGDKELESMKTTAYLLNTSRGELVNEQALTQALKEKKIKGAAIDVFEQEPYSGELNSLEETLLTCHMGSCSADCRLEMEWQATEEVVRFFRGEALQGLVPESEYKELLCHA